VTIAEPLVVKLGGSTLGAHDTALDDIVALHRQGRRVVVVHGGGAEITRWLELQQIPSRFVDGLRVTDAASLRVVVAVLAGLVNKELVAQLSFMGVRALGLSGVDGGLLQAELEREELGYVGAVCSVDPSPLAAALDHGLLPLVAPIALKRGTAQLLNVNGDTAAGAIAAALPGSTLVFLTDVPGVLDASGALVHRLTPEVRAMLLSTGALKGGMLPKIEAGARAAASGGRTVIVDGRQGHALLAALADDGAGTRVL